MLDTVHDKSGFKVRLVVEDYRLVPDEDGINWNKATNDCWRRLEMNKEPTACTQELVSGRYRPMNYDMSKQKATSMLAKRRTHGVRSEREARLVLPLPLCDLADFA